MIILMIAIQCSSILKKHLTKVILITKKLFLFRGSFLIFLLMMFLLKKIDIVYIKKRNYNKEKYFNASYKKL